MCFETNIKVVVDQSVSTTYITNIQGQSRNLAKKSNFNEKKSTPYKY
jgi:hypothetical protein